MSKLGPRRLTREEAPDFARVAELCFGGVATEEDISAVVAEDFDEDWSIGVYDSGELVATAGAVPFELTLPAAHAGPLPSIPAAGVTCVGVLPTHHRRGLLTEMMAFQLGQFREREVAVAILTASESVIYGRFGYGTATTKASLELPTKRSAFRELPYMPVAEGGRMRLVRKEEAAKVVPGVHAQAVRRRPGEVGRSDARWARLLEDPERDRRQAEGRMYVVHEDATGSLDGYASFRHRWQPEATWQVHHLALIEDLYALTPAVHAALWRFLLDIDLVEELRAGSRPVDEPLRWMLADARKLRTVELRDMLWAKLVDVPAALSARGYGLQTELVLEVGPAGGEGTARYKLETGPGSGSCRRAKGGEKTDLVLGQADLGAIYLGGCRPSELAAAGRVHEARSGALARADQAFVSPLAPFCGTSF